MQSLFIVLEQEDVVAMGSAASLCIHTLFLSLFVGSLVEAKLRVFAITVGALIFTFVFQWNELALVVLLYLLLLPGLEELLGALPFPEKNVVDWVSEWKQTRKIIHIL